MDEMYDEDVGITRLYILLWNFACPICLGCVSTGEVGRGYLGLGGQLWWLLQQL